MPPMSSEESLAHQADEVARRRVVGRNPRRLEVGVPVCAEHVAVMDDVVALAVVRSDYPHSGQALGDVGDHAGERVPYQEVGPLGR